MNILRIAAAALGVYVLLALVVNAIAGVVQPKLGVGAGEGVLRTFSDDGTVYERQLAVIHAGDGLWLVSVQYFRKWFHRLVENPNVELVQNGEVRQYSAVPDRSPEARARLTALLENRAGKFRFTMMRAVWLFAPIQPVRLDPR